jgi:hypothetical protein
MRARACTAALLAVLCAPGCETGPASEPPAASGAAAAGSGATAPAVLHLDSTSARRAGIEVAVVQPAQWVPEVEGYGRVVDPAPFVQAVGNLDAARSSAKTAADELAREEGLHKDQQNASMRDVEAARAAAARAAADVELAQTQLAATFGPVLAADPELPALTRRLARRQAALVRIDVPGGGDRPQPERGSTLVPFPGTETPLHATFLAAAPDTNPMLPGWSFLFLVAEAPPPVGTAIHAQLHGSGDDLHGGSIPAQALVHTGGGLFVFVRTAPDTYERRAVAARRRADGTAFVSAGVEPGDTVVTTGAAELLSAEQLQGSTAGAEPEDGRAS